MSENRNNDLLSTKEDDSSYPSPEQPEIQKSSNRFVSSEKKMRSKEQKLKRKADSRAQKEQSRAARLSRFAVFKLRKFEIDEGKLVRYIGHSSRVTIPAGITEIGDNALTFDWKYRTKFRKLIIPASVKTIGRQISRDSTRLKKIIYKGTKAQWKKIAKSESRTYENNWNYGINNRCIIYCTDGIICMR